MNGILKLFALVLVGLLAASFALADVWYWVDANGNRHFVDSNRAIWTWTDAAGKVFYSDRPDHEDAVRVQLFWHSDGTLEEATAAAGSGEAPPDPGRQAYDGETAEERAARESVVARNCKRAKEILDSYENAPKLYRTDDEGKRIILSADEQAATLADARAKTEFLCGQ